MNAFEDMLDLDLEKMGLCKQAVIQTGSAKKEWSLYIRDREQFMAAFNQSMAGKKQVPITINFYDDPEWSELKKVSQMMK